MSRNVIWEALFAARCVGIGVLITISYDLLRIFRKVIHHNRFFRALEDFLFWMFCAIFMFFILNLENDGIMRWYIIAFAGMGMRIYLKTLSPYFVYFMSTALSKTIHVVAFVLKKVTYPEKLVIQWTIRRIKKLCDLFTKKEKEESK